MGDETIDGDMLNHEIYGRNQQLDGKYQPDPSRVAGIAGNLKHQEIERRPIKHMQPIVPERGGMKQAAKDIAEANRRALADRGIAPEPESVEETPKPMAPQAAPKAKRTKKTKTTD